MYGYVKDSSLFIDIFGLNVFSSSIFWTAPSGITYQVYQRQDIDWNLPVNTSQGTKTNLDLASEGKSPFIVTHDIKTQKKVYNQINLHHSKQDARGPLFELPSLTHQKYYGTNALHPHLPNKHPYYPVTREAFDVDREAYWKERAKREKIKRGIKY